VKAEGWYRDPYLVHEDRWFSAGEPTALVRDGGVDGNDPPPAVPPKAELDEAPQAEPAEGNDLRRADDGSAEAGYYLKGDVLAPRDLLDMTSPPLPAPPLEESESWLCGSERDEPN
jgi:hypothetical protein